jgi:hypothetical protein
MDKNICILIPVYNEEPNVRKVIRELKKVNNKFHIVVINDGSTDKTASLAKNAGAIVLTNAKNMGSGMAMKKGLRYALAHNFSSAIQIDGDGQHNPKDIKKLIRALKTHTVDMVIGSRYIKKTTYKTPLLRYICIRTIAALYRLYNFHITDPTSGYRAFNKKAMKFLVKDYTFRYPEAISIAALIKNNFKIKEISITMKPRLYGKSSINILNGFYYFLLNITQIIYYRFVNKYL